MSTSESAVPSAPREAVAPANEQLLKSQNADLYNEYLEGQWAHVAPQPEAGGLIVCLPVQNQLVRMMREGEGGWGETLRARLLTDISSVDGDDGSGAEDEVAASERLFKQWAANTVYTYRLADGMIRETLEVVAQGARGGRVDLSGISSAQRELVTMYIQAQDSWQEVALVLRADGSARSEGSARAAESVVLNRPIARSMSRQLADMLLNGAEEYRLKAGITTAYDEAFTARFLAAFGEEAAVYVGGPDGQEEPGVVVHGLPLAGAIEVAPGTRVYTGGIEAAVEAVASGKASPLDFRWFVGRRRDVSISDGSWCPVACARPLALKQCLGLPKPLWHEVLEICGGEVAELSRIELLKREDLSAD